MCTVSWTHAAGGYHLFCNRDEKRTRSLAEPPTVRTRDGVRYLAPADGDFGGTWIAVNEFGISACLLNGNRPAPAARISRGWLLPNLMPCSTQLSSLDRLRTLDLESFASFTLLLLEPGRPPVAALWDGMTVNIEEPRLPLTSSSYDPERVRQARLREFERRLCTTGRLDAALLLGFHASHEPEPGPASTCMHRTGAATVSFSWINVTSHAVRFFYSPAPPCESLLCHSYSCLLSRHSAAKTLPALLPVS